MKKIQKFVLITALQLLSSAAIADQARLKTVTFDTHNGRAELMLDVSTVVTKGVFLLDNPARLVVDLKDTNLGKSLAQPTAAHPLFAKIRSGIRNGTDLRLVIDLKKALVMRDVKVDADKNSGQIIVQLQNHAPLLEKSEDKVAVAEIKTKPIAMPETDVKVEPKASVIAAESQAEAIEDEIEHYSVNHNDNGKEVVVAIDAGHGGVDAGAHGPNGTQEKKVVFSIAKRLAELINRQPGMRAVMVRKGDYYIKLRKRMEIAREAKADLFVSIHADAISNPDVKGASVYTLSNTGASSEAARWLANSENASDLAGGVSLDDKDDVLASVLLDLSQSATKEASSSVAEKILKSFNAIGKLHKNEVQKAGFMVLKSPDIPSILVETAFISNPTEEIELRDKSHQAKIASAVFKGIANYFREYAPAGTRMASSR